MKILLIEDEIGLADAICQILKKEHYLVTICNDGNSGLDEGLTDSYDVILLDLMLPGMDGFEILKELRHQKIATPVLILTALTELENRVRGLDSGANYYLTKPFEPQELLACIRAITRNNSYEPSGEIAYGDLILYPEQANLVCTSSGKSIHIASKELYLLELMMRQKGAICQKEWLIARVWGVDTNAEYNMLEVYISFLRKKLSFVESHVSIKATRGLGYSLDTEILYET